MKLLGVILSFAFDACHLNQLVLMFYKFCNADEHANVDEDFGITIFVNFYKHCSVIVGTSLSESKIDEQTFSLSDLTSVIIL